MIDRLRIMVIGLVMANALVSVAADAPWPHFHGPRRDNISPDTNLLKKWPDGGPKLLWKFDQCGGGYSGVAIAEDKIFTVGDFDEQEMLLALSLDGRLLWKAQNGAAWTGDTPGARTTPTYVDGVLYHMNPTGRVAAYQADTGRELWAVDLRERFGARYGVWAMAENLIVDGSQVLCVPGGKQGFVVALDKESGETIWQCTDMDEPAAYCSPILVEHNGVRQLITLTRGSAISVDVEQGKLLWSHPFGVRIAQNTTMPIYHDGHVFITAGHRIGGMLLKIDDDARGVSEAWFKRELDNCHGGVMLLDGRLYGCGCRLGGKQFFCVDFLTGELIDANAEVGKVSIAYADGMLYALNHKGPMYLMSVSRDGVEVVSSFDMPRESRDLYLCHPVICGGRLYLRHDKTLYVYDVRQ